MKLERNKESVADDISLYHITSHYEALLEDGEVYMKRPMYWEDTYEAYLIKKISEGNSLDKIAELMMDKFSGCLDSKLRTICDLLAINKCAYAFCLSDELPTTKKWKEYTKGKTGICLETSPRLLERAIQNELEKERVNVNIKKIDYLKSDAILLEAYFDWFKKNKTITDCYFHKTRTFDWEKETRLLIYNSEISAALSYGDINSYRRDFVDQYGESYPKISEILDGLNEKEQKKTIMQAITKVVNKNYKEDEPNDHFILKLRPADYIKSVYIHNASNEDKQIIERICKSQQIKICLK